MTMPDERYKSLICTKKFLLELLSCRSTPRVPKYIRQRALALLKHWPDDYHLEMLTIDMPKYFCKDLDPLYKMIKQYEENKENE